MLNRLVVCFFIIVEGLSVESGHELLSAKSYYGKITSEEAIKLGLASNKGAWIYLGQDYLCRKQYSVQERTICLQIIQQYQITPDYFNQKNKKLDCLKDLLPGTVICLDSEDHQFHARLTFQQVDIQNHKNNFISFAFNLSRETNILEKMNVEISYGYTFGLFNGLLSKDIITSKSSVNETLIWSISKIYEEEYRFNIDYRRVDLDFILKSNPIGIMQRIYYFAICLVTFYFEIKAHFLRETFKISAVTMCLKRWTCFFIVYSHLIPFFQFLNIMNSEIETAYLILLAMFILLLYTIFHIKSICSGVFPLTLLWACYLEGLFRLDSCDLFYGDLIDYLMLFSSLFIIPQLILNWINQHFSTSIFYSIHYNVLCRIVFMLSFGFYSNPLITSTIEPKVAGIFIFTLLIQLLLYHIQRLIFKRKNLYQRSHMEDMEIHGDSINLF